MGARQAQDGYYIMQHGMKGSIGGVSYEIMLDGGYSAGYVWRNGKKWWARVAKYDAPMGPFSKRPLAITALFAEYTKRNPERPSYYKDCDQCKGAGCHSCYAPKK